MIVERTPGKLVTMFSSVQEILRAPIGEKNKLVHDQQEKSHAGNMNWLPKTMPECYGLYKGWTEGEKTIREYSQRIEKKIGVVRGFKKTRRIRNALQGQEIDFDAFRNMVPEFWREQYTHVQRVRKAQRVTVFLNPGMPWHKKYKNTLWASALTLRMQEHCIKQNIDLRIVVIRKGTDTYRRVPLSLHCVEIKAFGRRTNPLALAISSSSVVGRSILFRAYATESKHTLSGDYGHTEDLCIADVPARYKTVGTSYIIINSKNVLSMGEMISEWNRFGELFK